MEVRRTKYKGSDLVEKADQDLLTRQRMWALGERRIDTTEELLKNSSVAMYMWSEEPFVAIITYRAPHRFRLLVAVTLQDTYSLFL